MNFPPEDNALLPLHVLRHLFVPVRSSHGIVVPCTLFNSCEPQQEAPYGTLHWIQSLRRMP